MPRSPCTSNGMAYHWIAQALWHCMTNTQSVGNCQQGHPKWQTKFWSSQPALASCTTSKDWYTLCCGRHWWSGYCHPRGRSVPPTHCVGGLQPSLLGFVGPLPQYHAKAREVVHWSYPGVYPLYLGIWTSTCWRGPVRWGAGPSPFGVAPCVGVINFHVLWWVLGIG